MAIKGQFADTALGMTVDFTRDSDGILTTYCFRRASGPTTDAGEIEVTNSCSDGAEFIEDVVDFGTLEVEINLNPDAPELNFGDKGDLVIKYPPKSTQTVGATRSGRAFVKSAPQDLPVRAPMTETITFRITGALTHVVGS